MNNTTEKIYFNKTNNRLSVEQICTYLNKFSIDCILVGSQVGKFYRLCESSKDIDFILNMSPVNINNVFLFLSKFFPMQNIDQVISLDRIVLRSLDNTCVELFMLTDANMVFPCKEYNKLKQNSNLVTLYDNSVSCLSLNDYIISIKNIIERPFFAPSDHDDFEKKMKKYQQILQNYSKMIQLYT